ncbi:TolB family protein [Pendulispora albinea]|uniref:Uncharacterized protein n=1 Tax=Pendulispora albinea TaxID=2741071 RepID=A0ABZ2LZ81_9BACT
MRARLLAVSVAMVVLVGIAIGYTLRIRKARASAASAPPVAPEQPISLSAAAPRQLLFRNMSAGPGFGRIAALSLDDPQATRRVADVACDRFASAAGVGLCLALRPAVLPPMTDLLVLDENLNVVRRLELPGTPSRAKLSRDGKMAFWTIFVSGDSYAENGFSTRAGVLDLTTGELTKTIEELPVFFDGKRYFANDVNYWGITFDANDTRFYATLSSRGKTHLVQADYRTYRGRALEENVECPSLSPDGKRIAFKRRVSPDVPVWRLSVMDLGTRLVVPLAETRNVDDQAFWLDDLTVMYALSASPGHSDIWSVPADGSGAPRLRVADASSPALGGQGP